MYTLQQRIGNLQHVLYKKIEQGARIDKVVKRLRKLWKSYHCLIEEWTGRFLNLLVNYIRHLGRKYTLQIVMGYPYNIRKAHYRGNQRPYGRKIVHQWNYRRVVEGVKWKLAQHGWKDHQVLAISESWTSKTCSRCGSKKTFRPYQAHFECKTCGYTLHADVNGAKNIDRRFIRYVTHPKYSTIRDLHSQTYYDLALFRSFTVLGQCIPKLFSCRVKRARTLQMVTW